MHDDRQSDPGEPELNEATGSAEQGEEQPIEEVRQTKAQAEDEAETEQESQPRPAAKLERLQKILAQAGVASRRHAEELITQGRVQVNGQTVTELGTKADPVRDHIRVDGKLLHGAERLRYFMLNKPKGYVTTVKDPEGRPTVIEFFSKMGERLYPVGRLDYLSEGLLLVTNDGELANQLTRAASGVEKTYLVKVSGQPTEDEMEILRSGVSIERGKPGEGRVRTAPARIRQVRQGENPWYEVVLIEGRNRELRKMFEEIGHFVEKIRRVGYGPLVLDVEPGKLRELEPEEVAALRRAAEGKLKPRRIKTTMLLPKEAGRAAGRAMKPRSGRPPMRGAKPFRPKAEGQERPERKPQERGVGKRPQGRAFTPAGEGGQVRREERPRFTRPEGPRSTEKPARFAERPPRSGERPARFGQKSGPARPFGEARRGAGGPRFEERKPAERPRRREEGFSPEERPRKPFRQREERPAFTRPEEPGRPFGKGPGKSWNKDREEGQHKAFGVRSAGRGGEAAGFKGKGRPEAGGRPTPEGRAKPGFGAKPGGFSKPKSGFKGKPGGGAPRSGPRPGGKRPGGAPGGRKRG